MMRIKNLLILGVVPVLVLGCAKEAPTTQSVASPTVKSPVATSTPISSDMSAEATKSVKQVSTKSGNFVSGEHPTQGTVRVVSQNGKTLIELDSTFKTSEMGPDLVVGLHRSSDVIGSTTPPAYPLEEGDYAVIAPLKKFSGAQSYEVPKTINVADYKSVVIWCRKFNATFGAANLM